MKIKRSHKRIAGTIMLLVGLSLLVSALLLPPPQRSEKNPLSTSINCMANWTNIDGLIIVSGDGQVFIVKQNSSSTIIYETSIAWLEANGFNFTGDLRELAMKVSSPKVVELVTRGGPPGVISVTASPDEGYKIFLSRGRAPECLSTFLESYVPLFNGTLFYAGTSTLPPLYDGWKYSGVPLDEWRSYGSPPLTVWVDRELGIVVAYMISNDLRITVAVEVGISG